MPDLHVESVHAFWDSYDRRTLYRVIVAIEHVEHWVIDGVPEIDVALNHLGEIMDQAQGNFELINQPELIRVFIQTRASRALRILQAMDIAKPGTASQILMFAEESSEAGDGNSLNKYSKLFLRRNLVFERLQLLSRVFANQRVSLVLKALEQQGE